eukprot:CAMPEP_0170821216 /NCGR_PEP_ID=MMETSP0733-20121128/42913_1 /TAXON_ID=186038 /ORGANISM="Fragilariopsis kerguelensis, Strain L26-C5" /LENGTH=107 /DNA_ID=CAMNT_0011182905 /DNA_START=279 /DNA_END=603 /DNA_ORIENTATION=-
MRADIKTLFFTVTTPMTLRMTSSTFTVPMFVTTLRIRLNPATTFWLPVVNPDVGTSVPPDVGTSVPPDVGTSVPPDVGTSVPPDVGTGVGGASVGAFVGFGNGHTLL